MTRDQRVLAPAETAVLPGPTAADPSPRLAILPAPRAGVRALAGTPSRLSFPSAHATSTTAAAILFGRLLRRSLVVLVVPSMALSRLVLNVHYPSDVVAGSALGAAVAAASRWLARRVAERPTR